MKVYANPFYLTWPAVFGLEDFLIELAREEFIQIEHSGRKRTIAFDRRNNATCGLMLSTRGQSNYVTLGEDARGRPIVRVRQTPSGTPMADVNFFVIGENGKGLYATYRGAGGLEMFGNILGKLYHAKVTERMETELEESGEIHDGDTKSRKAEEKKIRSKYRYAAISICPILSNPNFARELSAIKHFRAFDYVVPTIDDDAIPLKMQINMEKRSLHFVSKNQAVTKIRKGIASIVKSLKINDGTAHGSGANGAPMKASILPSHFCVARYPHDEVVVPRNLRLSAVRKLPMTRDLLELIEAHPHVFG